MVYQSFPQMPDQGHANTAVTHQPGSTKSPGSKKKEKKTGMEKLAKLGGLLVKQKADELEEATGIEKENKYKVYPISIDGMRSRLHNVNLPSQIDHSLFFQ